MCVCVVYISIYRQTDCFQVLATMNNAAMNMGVQIPFDILFSFPLAIYLEMRLLDHMVVLFLNF